MLKLAIAQAKTELRWLETVAEEADKRAPARYPQIGDVNQK